MQKKWAENSVTWMDCCRNLRNVCAHCGQLYNRNLPWTPHLPQEFIEDYAQDGKPIFKFRMDKRPFQTQKLWIAILALRFLYPDTFYPAEKQWNARIFPKIEELLETGDEKENKLLRIGWGFPDNWEEGFKIWDAIR